MSRRRVPAIPPGELAQADQDLALLADLARAAARHIHTSHCRRQAACPGSAVEALLEKAEDRSPGTRDRLLLVAVAELAERPREDAAYDLTDAGRAAVDDPRPGHPRGKAGGRHR